MISGVPPEVFFLMREWTAQMGGLLPVEWALRGFFLLSDWSPWVWDEAQGQAAVHEIVGAGEVRQDEICTWS